MASWSGVRNGLRSTGHGLFYAGMGLACVAFIVVGLIGVAHRDQPVYWGTFTETSTVCDSGPRRHCTNSGRWASDDGRIVQDGVKLDGFVEPGHSVRASYRPGGPMGDDENNIVHTTAWSRAWLWFPWVGAAVSAAAMWGQHRRWRRSAADRQRDGRASEPRGSA